MPDLKTHGKSAPHSINGQEYSWIFFPREDQESDAREIEPALKSVREGWQIGSRQANSGWVSM